MNKEKCLEQLREWEIDSFNLGSVLSGWYKGVFYDPEKGELFRTDLLSQNSWVEFDDMIYLCGIGEKNFHDTDFKYNPDTITHEEMIKMLEDYYWDADVWSPVEDWLDEIENWINRREDYNDDVEWRLQKPVYPY